MVGIKTKGSPAALYTSIAHGNLYQSALNLAVDPSKAAFDGFLDAQGVLKPCFLVRDADGTYVPVTAAVAAATPIYCVPHAAQIAFSSAPADRTQQQFVGGFTEARVDVALMERNYGRALTAAELTTLRDHAASFPLVNVGTRS